MLNIYLKFIIAVIVVNVICLNAVAHNFSRLTGIFIEKPFDAALHKGNIYVSVANYKTKFSANKTQLVFERYRNYLPDNETLLDEAKKWYNMTKNVLQ